MANGALLGIGAFYATSVGMSSERVAIFMGAAIAGAVVMQWPIGSISDRVSRRRALAAVTLAAAAVAVVATQLTPTGNLMVGTMFFFGGLTFPMYSLNLSHINDIIPEGHTVNASSLFVFITGLGAIAGPIVAAAVMSSPVDDAGFFWTLAAAHGALGVYAIYRMATSRGIPVASQKPYVPAPARASAVIMRLTKKREPQSTNRKPAG
jgi:MFS family permease